MNKTQTRLLARLNRHVLRPIGLVLRTQAEGRPSAWGKRPIIGSFPPFRSHSSIGDASEFFIHPGYRPRSDEVYFDDRGNRDESQLEVYEYAREISELHECASVCDIGCGSGYKLMTHLGHLQTTGVDVPRTRDWLRRKFPNRNWIDLQELAKVPPGAFDLVIAADVIEHLADPNQLLTSIERLQPRWVVISTPERDLMRAGTYNGPPENPAHVREWNFAEFEAYLSAHFQVVDHFISCAPQATQCALCRIARPKPGSGGGEPCG